MPHFVLEHTLAFPEAGDVRRALELVFETGAASGIMQAGDIKVRAIPCEHALAGNGMTSFVHVTVSLLAGRTAVQKESLAVALRTALDRAFPEIESISIDVRDMDPVAYKKRLLTP